LQQLLSLIVITHQVWLFYLQNRLDKQKPFIPFETFLWINLHLLIINSNNSSHKQKRQEPMIKCLPNSCWILFFLLNIVLLIADSLLDQFTSSNY
jgi:hypothetical protein